MMPRTRTLIEGGSVLSMDPTIGDFRRADVLIEDGVISAVGPGLEVGDAEIIDAGGRIVMPGLVDSHRHLWYAPIRGSAMDHTMRDLAVTFWPQVAAHFTPEDVYASTRAGIADALDHGITTVLDWCHIINTPDHALEAMRAHRELPMRAVFAYGASMQRKLAEFDGLRASSEWEPIRRLRASQFASDESRLTMAIALQGPDSTAAEMLAYEVGAARELDLPMSTHVGVPAGRPNRPHGIKILADLKLLADDMNFVHCCTTTEDEFQMVAQSGASATVSPMAELALAQGEPPIGRMRASGVHPAIGADAVCTSSGDLFEEARIGLLVERQWAASRVYAEGREVEDAAQLGMTAREALETITINGARACWLADSIGTLTPGKAADLILLRATDLNLSPASDLVGVVAGCAHGGNVDTVFVDGIAVKRDGKLIDIDVKSIEAGLVAARDRLFSVTPFDGLLPA